MGKSTWVPFHTQGFIPIVADGTVYLCPAVDEEWALGRHLLLILLICFCGSVIMNWHYVFELWWQMLASNFKFASATIYWTWFVITLVVLWWMNCIYEPYVICDIYVESCTILVVCWWLIETRRGTRWTTGFIWAQVWQCDRLWAAIVLVLL